MIQDCEGAPVGAQDEDNAPPPARSYDPVAIVDRVKATLWASSKCTEGVECDTSEGISVFRLTPEFERLVELGRSQPSEPQIEVGPGVRVAFDGLRWTARLTPEADHVLLGAGFFGEPAPVELRPPTTVTLETATINASEPEAPAPEVSVGQVWRTEGGARWRVRQGPNAGGLYGMARVEMDDDNYTVLTFLGAEQIRDTMTLDGADGR